MQQASDAPTSPGAASTSKHDFEVLRRAYRVLRDDYAALTATLAQERASHAAAAAERGKLLARAEAAERKCREWEEEVLVGARRGAAALDRHARSTAAAKASAAEPANPPVASGIAVVSPAASVGGSSSLSAGEGGSSESGRWADRVLTGVTLFSSALSTSLESVSALAVPPSVQETLDLQEDALVAHEQVRARMCWPVARACACVNASSSFPPSRALLHRAPSRVRASRLCARGRRCSS